MERPLVTIVIPVYNSESYIERCIFCLDRQTYKNLEVIFVDDGSTDASYTLLEKNKEIYGYIEVIHTQNRGVSAARNTGVKNAKGKYIVYADVDDYFYEDYIEYMLSIAIKYDADIAMCDYLKIADKDNLRKEIFTNDVVKQYSRIEALENISYRKELSAAVPGKMIKQDIAKECYFEETTAYYEDYLYFCMVLNKCKKIFFGNQIKYLYLQNPKSSTHQYDCIKCVNSWRSIKDAIENEIAVHPEIEKAYVSKMLAISLDMLKKIYGQGFDEKEIREYIRKHSALVVKDKKCKRLKRLLSLSAYINISFTVVLGKILLRVLSKLGKEL